MIMNTIRVSILTLTCAVLAGCGGTAVNNSAKPVDAKPANVAAVPSPNTAATPAPTPGRGVPDSSIPDVAPSGGNYDKPEKVVEDIFYAAKAGRMASLPALCNPDGSGDKDTKDICGIGTATDEKLSEFRKEFRNGKIVGEPVIKGDTAKVKFKFGADGNKDEEFELKLVKGRWYLQSF